MAPTLALFTGALPGRNRRRVSYRVMRLIRTIALLFLLAAAPAAADPGEASPTWVPDGPVNAIAISGSTAYVGGSFGTLAPYTGGSAALDAVTGERHRWPDVAGTVNAVASDGAGGWYLGGSFASVAGVPRQN